MVCEAALSKFTGLTDNKAGINEPQCLGLNQVYPWDGSKGSTTIEFVFDLSGA